MKSRTFFVWKLRFRPVFYTNCSAVWWDAWDFLFIQGGFHFSHARMWLRGFLSPSRVKASCCWLRVLGAIYKLIEQSLPAHNHSSSVVLTLWISSFFHSLISNLCKPSCTSDHLWRQATKIKVPNATDLSPHVLFEINATHPVCFLVGSLMACASNKLTSNSIKDSSSASARTWLLCSVVAVDFWVIISLNELSVCLANCLWSGCVKYEIKRSELVRGFCRKFNLSESICHDGCLTILTRAQSNKL